MPYATAFHAVLGFADNAVYTNCRYSLLHKIFQDATYSSTNEWRYRHPKFFWSREVIDKLMELAGMNPGQLEQDRIEVTVPDLAAARKLLRQEHVVPTGVAIQHLIQLPAPDHSQIAQILEVVSTVCIVTHPENRRLHKSRMPPQEPNFMVDRWARYRFPRVGNQIKISPYMANWPGMTLVFTKRPQIEIDGAP